MEVCSAFRSKSVPRSPNPSFEQDYFHFEKYQLLSKPSQTSQTIYQQPKPSSSLRLCQKNSVASKENTCHPHQASAVPERTLSKNHTAIDDLQDLVSPKNEGGREVKKGGFEASERVPSAKQNHSEHGGHLQSTALGSGHFSVEYYRAEIKRLTFQLTTEGRKHEDLLFNLSELEK